MRSLFTILFLAFCISSRAQLPEGSIFLSPEARHRAEVTQKLHELYNEGMRLQKKKKTDEALAIFREYLDFADSEGRDTTYMYTECLLPFAHIDHQNGLRKEAIAKMERIVAIRRTCSDVRPGNLSSAIVTLASYYNGIGRIDTAIVLQKEALEIDKRFYGIKNEKTARDQVNLAIMLYNRKAANDVEEAITLTETALNRLPSGKEDQAKALISLAVYYSSAGNNTKATKYANKAIKMAGKIYGKESYNYAEFIASYCVNLARTHNYSSAIDNAMLARDIFEKVGVESIPYGKLMYNLGSFLHIVERYEEAVEAYKKAIEIFTVMEGEKGKETLMCLNELTTVYNHMGEMEKAESAQQEVTGILKSGTVIERNSLEYARAQHTHAASLLQTGDYTNAIACENEAVEIYKSKKDLPNLAMCYNQLATMYYNKGDLATALDNSQLAVDCYTEAGQTNTGNYAQALNLRSIMLNLMGNTQEALDLSVRAAGIYESIKETDNSYYARILGNQALYHSTLGNDEKAIELQTSSLEIQERILGKEHPDNVMSVFNLAVYYKNDNRQQEADSTYHRALNMQMNYVQRNFTHLTSRGREQYWNKKSYVLRSAPDFAYSSNHSDDMITDVYNTMLFTKGLLLNSEVDFRNLLSSVGDTRLQRLFEEMVDLNRRIDDAARPESEISESKLKQMREDVARMERELVTGCKEFGDFTKNLSITVDDITKAMADDEVAVEFMKVNLRNEDYAYAALVLRKDWEAPKMVHLFTQKQMNEEFVYDDVVFTKALQMREGVDSIFTDPRVGEMVWQKLIEIWGDNVRNVYFSPDGMMYQWGIEYLTCGELGRMSDAYNMHRVSSTKRLCQRSQETGIHSAAIFGGMDYDLGLTDILLDHETLHTEGYKTYYAMANTDDVRDLDFANNEAMDSLVTRGLRATYLEGALTEANAIMEMMTQHNVSASMCPSRRGGVGSEEQFKSLSGKKTELVHIATHGFYFTTEDMSRNFSELVARTDEDNANDNSMNCSGLLMAGANYALKGGRLDKGIENGILTAREISLLDLRNLNLVVLSACKTGMGEVKDDGVFGLQRGFKKAGAETLMMSLWSVSDHVTQLLMTTFYNALLEGATKHEAHRRARQAVIDAGHTKPYYWASFIMLD